MNKKEQLVLEILVLKGRNAYMSGRDIIKESDGGLGFGTVYIYLSRLENRDLISSIKRESIQNCLPSREYKIEDSGRQILREIEIAF